jgi:hypothetical protein
MDRLEKYNFYMNDLFEIDIAFMYNYSVNGIKFPKHFISLLVDTENLLNEMYADDDWDNIPQYMENINILTQILNKTIS